MKVATWNLDQLRPNGARAARQLEYIREVKADVWVFTEAHRNFLHRAFLLEAGYACIACSSVAADLPNEDARWVAIWSRLPAEAVNLTDDLERCAAIRLSESGVVVVGTVLPWMGDARQRPLRGCAAFQARLTEQSAGWMRLQAETDGRLCVTGDFNQDLLPLGHYYGCEDGQQALRATLADCELRCLTGDHDDPLTGVPNLAGVDHICVGKRLRPTTNPPSAVWPIPGALPHDLGDHYGVWAELELA